MDNVMSLTTENPTTRPLEVEVIYAEGRESTEAFRTEGPTPTDKRITVVMGFFERTAESVIWGDPVMDAAKSAIVASVMTSGSSELPAPPPNS
jgi:hypothetical protein